MDGYAMAQQPLSRDCVIGDSCEDNESIFPEKSYAYSCVKASVLVRFFQGVARYPSQLETPHLVIRRNICYTTSIHPLGANSSCYLSSHTELL